MRNSVKALITLGLLAGGLTAVAPASANGSLSITLGTPGYYVQPAPPVYVQPAPPVYVQPAPIYPSYYPRRHHHHGYWAPPPRWQPAPHRGRW
jgi:hypothetical protein